ncbi:hypothetical protein [Chitinophaga japonensis]|uniref:Outer membrane protein with beta-barrel domain n=1 Tax=Chitinophaga japonensis TaxID=104662 RepID=A0A562TC38_CHIJA|nr:hypothetical protein [Chitinophaga japonensis]TWI90646.1 hypothetical protein LX66_0006 [Chitinophaga japonensis]
MRFFCYVILCLGCLNTVCAQDSTLSHLQQFPGKYFAQINSKSNRFEKQVSRRSEKALNKLARQERKMQARLAKIDSVAAKNIFTRSIDSLGNLKSKLHQKTAGLQASAGSYSGYLDTLQNSLSFLKDAKKLGEQSKALQDKLNGSLQHVQALQSKLQQAEQIKAYIRERKQQLKEQLAQYTGFSKDLQKINKEAYYYGQQLREYKELLKDKKKAEARAMELLKQVSAYNSFLQKHSQLASLFNLSAAGNTAQNLEGLQTRAQVEQLIQQRLGSGGPNAQAAVSQQLSQARERFNELKDKFPNVDNAADMPDFKPNEMKSKSFLQRLEFGGNLQFQRSSQYFPTTSDIAGQVAYQFHKNGSAGIGAAYKLGMGTGFNNIRFSHQGVGLRSFLDWKLKGTFYINGGFEQNYNSQLLNEEQLRNFDNWQGSALIGISKKYKISSKLKGNIILLYDFLHNQHVPRTDPIKLRLGYNF